MPLGWMPGFNRWSVYGEPFHLTCPLKGNPPPVYHWKKYSFPDLTKPINLTDDLSFTEDSCEWSVAFYEEQHNGMYVCYAENALGAAEYVNTGVFYLYATSESR